MTSLKAKSSEALGPPGRSCEPLAELPFHFETWDFAASLYSTALAIPATPHLA